MADPDTLRQQRDRFIAFAFSAADLLIEIGPDGRIVFAGGAGTGIVGRTADKLMGQPFLDIVHVRDRRMVDLLLQGLGSADRRGPIRIRIGDGTRSDKEPLGQVMMRLSRMPGEARTVYCSLTAARASTDDTAGRDAESGILDRDGFLESARRLMDPAQPGARDARMTLLDLPEMDRLTARMDPESRGEVARSVGAALRANSVDGDAAARLDDWRFGVVHGQGVDAGRLKSAIGDALRVLDPSMAAVSVSAATLDLAAEGLSASEAVNAMAYVVNQYAADGAVVPATLAVALQDMIETTIGRISEFKDMVGGDRFTLAFQPIVDLTDRSIHHHEVLARFQDGRSPFDTIKFAEAIGIVEQFDLAVLRRSIALLEKPGGDGHLKLAVNLSGRSVQNDVFVKILLALLDQAKAIAPRLSLEVTESAEIVDLDKIDRVLQEIRGHGFSICIDDFGAGAASFRYLSGLTVDFLKIDGAYVKRMVASRRDFSLVKFLAQLCKEMQIKTVAEMVETENQHEALVGVGITHGQGWLYGKPLAEPLASRPAVVAPAVRPRRRAGGREEWA